MQANLQTQELWMILERHMGSQVEVYNFTCFFFSVVVFYIWQWLSINNVRQEVVRRNLAKLITYTMSKEQ